MSESFSPKMALYRIRSGNFTEKMPELFSEQLFRDCNKRHFSPVIIRLGHEYSAKILRIIPLGEIAWF